LIDVRQAQQVVGKSLMRWRSDVTIPDGQQVQPGERFRKTWRVLNDGETTWGNGYELVFFKDNPMGTGIAVSLPPLAPGQEGEISVELIAPTTPGRHKSTWKPRDPQGRIFTFELYADISVAAPMGEVIQGSCNATVRRDTQAKLRNAPSMTGQQLATLNPSTAVRVMGVTADRDSDGFRWIQVNANGQQGYIREDLLTYAADCANLDLPVTDDSTDDDSTGQTPNPQVIFPTPVQGGYIVYQEFGVNGHKGSDLSGAIGLGITAGGNGVVTQVIRCTFCTDSAPNFASHGLPMWDANAIRDIRWGYGFGHHVIVCYAWNDLPGNMRVAMTNAGLAGGYAYVVYAHLHRINVELKQRVAAGTVLGQLGNTGNSSGPHLHIEVRVADQPNLTSIFQKLVMNPRTMFDI
jgi:murein DD-endopeptidase MepM/ murein hydrolase activator NlpD